MTDEPIDRAAVLVALEAVARAMTGLSESLPKITVAMAGLLEAVGVDLDEDDMHTGRPGSICLADAWFGDGPQARQWKETCGHHVPSGKRCENASRHVLCPEFAVTTGVEAGRVVITDCGARTVDGECPRRATHYVPEKGGWHG